MPVPLPRPSPSCGCPVVADDGDTTVRLQAHYAGRDARGYLTVCATAAQVIRGGRPRREPVRVCLLLLAAALVAPARAMAGADAFQFPFTPYAVQTELMTSVYAALSEGQVGIFESPTGVCRCARVRRRQRRGPAVGTRGVASGPARRRWRPLSRARGRGAGTGKSMSLICSSLRWLKENPVYVPLAQDAASEDDDDLPAWVCIRSVVRLLVVRVVECSCFARHQYATR